MNNRLDLENRPILPRPDRRDERPSRDEVSRPSSPTPRSNSPGLAERQWTRVVTDQVREAAEQRENRPEPPELVQKKKLLKDVTAFADSQEIAMGHEKKIGELQEENNTLNTRVAELPEEVKKLRNQRSIADLASNEDTQKRIEFLEQENLKVQKRKAYYRARRDDLGKEAGESHEEVKRLTKMLRDNGIEPHNGRNWSNEKWLFDIEQMKRFASEEPL